MLESFRQNRASQLLGTAVSVFRANDWTLNLRDPDDLRYMASVWVWVRWFMVATCLVQLVYRPWYGQERYAAYALLYLDLDASPTFPALVRNPCLFRFRAIVKTVLRAMASSHRARMAGCSSGFIAKCRRIMPPCSTHSNS